MLSCVRFQGGIQAVKKRQSRRQQRIVIRVHGHEISQNCAADLYARGMNVRFLEGGFEAWRLAGGVVVAKDVPRN